MRCIEYTQLGNPAQVLKLVEGPSPALGVGEVRVEVLAAPIHPSNLLQISGSYGTTADLPSTPGAEGVGRVIELDSQVTHLNVGQLVLLAGGGTWAEELAGPAEMFIPLPDFGEVTPTVIEQLSMVAVNPLSALLMLDSFVDLKEGDWLVQSAANSAVGGYMIQLAKARGVKTINIVRREELVDELLEMGADVVLVDGDDLSQRILDATGGAPLQLALDAVGGDTFTNLSASLSQSGTIVAYGALSMMPSTLESRAVIFNDIRVRGFWLSRWFEAAAMEDKQQAFGKIIPLVASGAIKAKVDSSYSLGHIADAVTRASEAGRDGKVLLVPNKN